MKYFLFLIIVVCSISDLMAQSDNKKQNPALQYQKEYSGKIKSVDQVNQQMIVVIDGKDFTIRFTQKNSVPKIGKTIKFTEQMNAAARPYVYESCEKCNAECPGVCFMMADLRCRCYLFHL